MEPMVRLESSVRYPKIRKLFLLGAVFFALLAVFLPFTGKQGDFFVWLPMLCACCLIAAFFMRAFKLTISEDQEDLPNSFRVLSTSEREGALKKAWQKYQNKPKKPEEEAEPDILRHVMWFFLIIFITFVAYYRIIELVGENAKVQKLIITIGACLVSGGIGFFWARHIQNDYIALANIMNKKMIKYYTSLRVYKIRELAVQWVNDNYNAWLKKAEYMAESKSVKQFDLNIDSTKSFPLLQASDKWLKDMPPEKVGIVVLVCGPFLGVRTGFFFDVVKTSYSIAVENGDVVSEDKSPEETEFHYRDIVTVKYDRKPKGDEVDEKHSGEFLLKLVNGESISYETLERPDDEKNADSAVAAVRKRTREVKSSQS